LQLLGPLEIDLLYQKEELFIRFKCQNQDVADALSAAREELVNSLSAFPRASVSIGLGAERPDRALIRKLIPAEKTLLDTRV
ncbi:MAG: flagellar hook-length control protein FliK, partial [Desulfuromonadaceae bacterium]